MNWLIGLSSPYPTPGRFSPFAREYCTDELILRREVASIAPPKVNVFRPSPIPGSIPFRSRLVNPKRPLRRSVEAATETFVVSVVPVLKKLRTLFGCDTQGVG